MSTSLLKLHSNITHRRILWLTWHALLGDLSVVDLLLKCEVAHQPVDMTRLPLTVAVDAAHGLGVVARVPGGIKHHHTVRSDQVYTQTTSPGAQRGHVILCPNLNISLLLFSSIYILLFLCMRFTWLTARRPTQRCWTDHWTGLSVSLSLRRSYFHPVLKNTQQVRMLFSLAWRHSAIIQFFHLLCYFLSIYHFNYPLFNYLCVTL